MNIHRIAEDIHVSGMIARTGVWESAQIELFTKMLIKYPSALVIDIGINIGMYALVAAANNHRVIGFEPLQKNLNVLCSSINNNRWNNLITVYNVALTNKRTKVSFRTPYENAGGTEVYDNDGLHGTLNKDYANAYPFDDFDIVHASPIIMKIDIEGHECQLFESSENFFKNNNVVIIFMEWGNLAQKCGRTVADKLYGYGLIPYREDGMKRLSIIDRPWLNVWDTVWRG